MGVDHSQQQVNAVGVLHTGKTEKIATRFLTGADGGHSRVAQLVPGLDKNKRFLLGYEEVHFGTVHLGPHPEETNHSLRQSRRF